MAVALSAESTGRLAAAVAGKSWRLRDDARESCGVVELETAWREAVLLDDGAALERGRRCGGSPTGACVILSNLKTMPHDDGRKNSQPEGLRPYR